jgi:hypothetical protein
LLPNVTAPLLTEIKQPPSKAVLVYSAQTSTIVFLLFLTQINVNFGGWGLFASWGIVWARPPAFEPQRGSSHVSNWLLPDSGIACGGPVQRRRRANLRTGPRKKACSRYACYRFIENFHIDAGRELDRRPVGGGKKRVGQGHSQMDFLPEAVEQKETRRSEELAVPLQMHDDLREDGSCLVVSCWLAAIRL